MVIFGKIFSNFSPGFVPISAISVALGLIVDVVDVGQKLVVVTLSEVIFVGKMSELPVSMLSD